jgi:hypothetical protein
LRDAQDPENGDRLFHRVGNRAVPSGNNLAERDLGPSVLARKVRLGSVRDAGAGVRGIPTTVVTSLRKRGPDPAEGIEEALGAPAMDPDMDRHTVLFPRDGRDNFRYPHIPFLHYIPSTEYSLLRPRQTEWLLGSGEKP